MIILDTNVVSEPLRPRPDPHVRSWLNRQAPETLYLSAVTVAELMLGVEVLPNGRRRSELRTSVGTVIADVFGDRVLPFDEAVAEAYASLIASARAGGRSVSFADGQIAATASFHGFAVATRDATPFEACGVTVIDPWA